MNFTIENSEIDSGFDFGISDYFLRVFQINSYNSVDHCGLIQYIKFATFLTKIDKGLMNLLFASFSDFNTFIKLQSSNHPRKLNLQ